MSVNSENIRHWREQLILCEFYSSSKMKYCFTVQQPWHFSPAGPSQGHCANTTPPGTVVVKVNGVRELATAIHHINNHGARTTLYIG